MRSLVAGRRTSDADGLAVGRLVVEQHGEGGAFERLVVRTVVLLHAQGKWRRTIRRTRWWWALRSSRWASRSWR